MNKRLGKSLAVAWPALAIYAGAARADDAPPSSPAQVDPGHAASPPAAEHGTPTLATAPHPPRYGLILSTGGGVAGIPHSGPLPGAIGFTDLGVEIFGELRPWGLFVRGDFLSSGNDGRWTSFGVMAGTQYRLFGDLHHTALFLRGGLVYEHMIGNDTGCPVSFFVPSSCNLLGSQQASFSAEGELVGLVLGARVEVPIPIFYLAFGASFVPTVDVGGSIPAGTFELRFDMEVGFRDQRTEKDSPRSRVNEQRRKH